MSKGRQMIVAAILIAVALLGFWMYKERTTPVEQPAQSAPQPDGYGNMKIPPQQQ